jgi:TonB family protein
MKFIFGVAILSLGAALPLILPAAKAQQPPSPPQGPVVKVTKLFPPAYPPLARQAEIAGDVVIRLMIGQDGTVLSAEVVTGHPVLKQAALDSAKKSEFECHGCGSSGASYSLTYTFAFYPDGVCREHAEAYSVRSARCLYLWKCGRRKISTWGLVYRDPSTTQSGNHVTLLISGECLQTEAAQE